MFAQPLYSRHETFNYIGTTQKVAQALDLRINNQNERNFNTCTSFLKTIWKVFS